MKIPLGVSIKNKQNFNGKNKKKHIIKLYNNNNNKSKK